MASPGNGRAVMSHSRPFKYAEVSELLQSLHVSQDFIRKIDSGEMLHFHNFMSIAPGTSLDTVLHVKEYPVHIYVSCHLGGNGLVNIFENPALVGTPTEVSGFNRNRKFAASLGRARFSPSVSVSFAGVRLTQNSVSIGPRQPIGSTSPETACKWILAPNTMYLFRLTNVDTVSRLGTVMFDYFEDRT